MKYAVAIDIGGTNTRVALVDESYNFVAREQFATNPNDSKETFDELAKRIKSFDKPICGVGMSCPGPLDLLNGKILFTPNLTGDWTGLCVVDELSRRTGLPVYLENDANLAALAEAVIGPGKDYRFVQFFTVSTGLGAGFIINKKIYQGAHGFANEVAQSCVWHQGPSHGNIYPGGIEAISSGTAITTRAKNKELEVAHAGEVNELALQGNKEAQEIMQQAKQYLANYIATVIGFADPDIIVLGGPVALRIDGFVEDVEKLVKEQVFDVVRPTVKIVKSTLNEERGLLGAACLAFSKDSTEF